MFLSGEWLSQHGADLISPFDAERIDCAAYEMRVGGEAYVSPDDGSQRKPSLMQLGYNEPVSIPPGQFAFLITREFISVPHELIAFINIKNGLKVSGLVNVSGFHVDPGYRGNLIFAVFNAGPRTVQIRNDQAAFLIWFARLEAPSEAYAKKGVGFTGINSELIARIPSESASLNSLKNRLDQVERRVAYTLGALTLAGALAVAAVAGVIASVVGGVLELW